MNKPHLSAYHRTPSGTPYGFGLSIQKHFFLSPSDWAVKKVLTANPKRQKKTAVEQCIIVLQPFFLLFSHINRSNYLWLDGAIGKVGGHIGDFINHLKAGCYFAEGGVFTI